MHRNYDAAIVLAVVSLGVVFWGHDMATAAERAVTVHSGEASVTPDPVHVEFVRKGRGVLGAVGAVAHGAVGAVPIAGPVVVGAAGAAIPTPKYEDYGTLAGAASDNQIPLADSISFDFWGPKDEMLELELARFGRKGGLRRVSIDPNTTLDYIDPKARIELVYANVGKYMWHLTTKTALAPGQYGMFLKHRGPVADFEVVASPGRPSTASR
jgi:hypothetical protein